MSSANGPFGLDIPSPKARKRAPGGRDLASRNADTPKVEQITPEEEQRFVRLLCSEDFVIKFIRNLAKDKVYVGRLIEGFKKKLDKGLPVTALETVFQYYDNNIQSGKALFERLELSDDERANAIVNVGEFTLKLWQLVERKKMEVKS